MFTQYYATTICYLPSLPIFGSQNSAHHYPMNTRWPLRLVLQFFFVTLINCRYLDEGIVNSSTLFVVFPIIICVFVTLVLPFFAMLWYACVACVRNVTRRSLEREGDSEYVDNTPPAYSEIILKEQSPPSYSNTLDYIDNDN